MQRTRQTDPTRFSLEHLIEPRRKGSGNSVQLRRAVKMALKDILIEIGFIEETRTAMRQ